MTSLVFLEHHEGELLKGSLGVLSKAAQLDGDVAGVVLGAGVGELAEQAGAYGAEKVYVVDDGEIRLERRLADGTVEILAIARPGDYFGELAPLFGLQRAATATAAIPSRVTSYSVRDFRTLKAPGPIAELLDHAADTGP
jgi:CRP-like cAMP-binding protein